jgi:hypothetical protein
MKLILTQEKKLEGHKYIIGMQTLNADDSLACTMSESTDIGYRFGDWSALETEEDMRVSVHENLIRAFTHRNWEIEIRGDMDDGLRKYLESCKPSKIKYENWEAPNQFPTSSPIAW